MPYDKSAVRKLLDQVKSSGRTALTAPEARQLCEACGVVVGVKSTEQAAQAYDTIVANARKYDANAEILGVQVQQMLGTGVVLNFNPPPARYRPDQDLIVRQMNRIMRPDAVAVIGASAENGKIGNSVMKNLINGGYRGAIYPIHPSAANILGGARRSRGEEDTRRGTHPLRLRRNGQCRRPGGARSHRAQIWRAPDTGRGTHRAHLRKLKKGGTSC